MLVTGSKAGDLLLWDVNDLCFKEKTEGIGSGGNITAIKFHPHDHNLCHHKNKVTHAEFSPREPWLLCTASVDHTVKMWDIRNIKDKTRDTERLKSYYP